MRDQEGIKQVLENFNLLQIFNFILVHKINFIIITIAIVIVLSLYLIKSKYFARTDGIKIERLLISGIQYIFEVIACYAIISLFI